MKTADLKRAAPWTKPAALAVATLLLALTSTGCAPECEDAFDCRNDNGPPPAGERWTCRDEKCSTVPIEEPEPEPGADAGTDAGADAGVDAGTGTDAGTDAGTNPCDALTHDAKLGTLQLQTGFQAGESAPLPAGITAVAATPGPTYSLYALNEGSGKDAALVSLGTWPQLQASTTKVYDLVTEADLNGAASVFPGGYLAHDGKRLFAGYTLSTDAMGSLLIHDITTPSASTHLSAPKNYSAAVFSSDDTQTLLVNGGGLGSASGGMGVYALVSSGDRFTPAKVANFPAGVSISGFTAVAANGITMLGYYDGINQAHAVAPAAMSEAISSGTAVELGTQPKFDVGSDFSRAAAFGDGVALNRGSFNMTTFNFDSTDVSRYALTIGISDVAIGDRVPVLTYDANQCTSVVLMSNLGPDLLVGVEDKNGRRLVLIQQAR